MYLAFLSAKLPLVETASTHLAEARPTGNPVEASAFM
jgi:hypothetical protein